MYQIVKKCPACNHQDFTKQIVCKDYTVSKENFAIVSCNNCNLWFTSPRPKGEDLGRFYQSENYISHANKGNNLVNILYKIVRNYTLRQKTSLIKSFLKKGSILDYGCGTGDFLRSCQRAGFDIQGIEPDAHAREQSSKLNGIHISKDLSSMHSPEPVDFITLWHVLEHVDHLQNTLAQLKALLKSSGHLLIAVPNHEAYDAQHYKEYWAAYDVPRHLYHFNQLNIRQLADNLRLKHIATYPQYFDSFYVSMLSEKYKNGGSILRGFLTGLKSNILASKDHNNYSSLIYILRKT